VKNDIRVVATGIGVVSSNGVGKDEFSKNIFTGISGLRESERIKMLNVSTDIGGEIIINPPMFNSEKYKYIAMKAIDEAYEDSGINREFIKGLKRRASLSMGSSNGNSYDLEKYARAKSKGDIIKDNLLFESKTIKAVASYVGTKGDMYLTNTACASSTAAAAIGYDLIKNNLDDLVVVGAVDVFNDLSIVGFNCFQNLSKDGCKPFDKNRDGISLGEAGVFIILENLESALERGADIYGEIVGYGLSNDAYHYTSPDPDGNGAYYCMKNCIDEANISADKVNYINAHGTGTKLNDNMEAIAISRLFNKDIKVSSSKSMTGHCLGAAGGVELAVCFLSIKKGIIPPSISINEKDSICDNLNIVTDKISDQEYNYAISNSFGFGGNCASILIKKWLDN